MSKHGLPRGGAPSCDTACHGKAWDAPASSGADVLVSTEGDSCRGDGDAADGGCRQALANMVSVGRATNGHRPTIECSNCRRVPLGPGETPTRRGTWSYRGRASLRRSNPRRDLQSGRTTWSSPWTSCTSILVQSGNHHDDGPSAVWRTLGVGEPTVESDDMYMQEGEASTLWKRRLWLRAVLPSCPCTDKPVETGRTAASREGLAFWHNGN